MIEYKSRWYGRELIIINRFFPSSKLCNVCGFKKKDLSLCDRSWICPECGTEHNRDFNAALNIRDEGIRIIGVHYTKFTLVDNPTMDDKELSVPLKSSAWMKQEDGNKIDLCNT